MAPYCGDCGNFYTDAEKHESDECPNSLKGLLRRIAVLESELALLREKQPEERS